MENIKFWTNTITVIYAIGFFDGFLGLGISDDVYMITGFAAIFALVMLHINIRRASKTE